MLLLKTLTEKKINAFQINDERFKRTQKNRARNNLNTHLSRTLSSGVLFYFGSLVKSISS